jgi:hypothetical protein
VGHAEVYVVCAGDKNPIEIRGSTGMDVSLIVKFYHFCLILSVCCGWSRCGRSINGGRDLLVSSGNEGESVTQ